MFRTDKATEYLVCFDRPRKRRGGNVWQHLRSFRKRLFDAVPDEALRLDGEYVDVANDWAFMPPIVEMAAHPAYIVEPLYLYEPSGIGKGAGRRPLRLPGAGLAIVVHGTADAALAVATIRSGTGSARARAREAWSRWKTACGGRDAQRGCENARPAPGARLRPVH